MKKFLALLLALTMALALVACGGGDDAASDTTADSGDDAAASTGEFEEMTWKFACSATETSPWVDGAKEFARIVGEKTGGAITVQYYPADQLTAGNQTDGIQALMDGTTELSMHSNLIWSSFDQRFNVVSLPFLFSSTEEADAALDGAGGEALGEILESTYNVHLLGIAENGFRHITNSKHAIASKADMNGLKMRVAGSQLLNRSYELWGADYTNANWSEVFTALQTGTYDGQENPLGIITGNKFEEVQSYCTLTEHVYTPYYVVMNQAKWDSLTAEQQEALTKAVEETTQRQYELSQKYEDEAIEVMEGAGCAVRTLTDEEKMGFKEAADKANSLEAAKKIMYKPELADQMAAELDAYRNK